MRGMAWAAVAAIIGLATLATGCSNRVSVSQPATAAGSDAAAAGFTTFPDMPMPTSSEIDVDGTLIFGAGDSWFGRLVINASHDAGDMFDFYRQGLPGFGWQEVTSVRAAVSVLTYTRQDRVATIQIQGHTLRGSEISITVSPRGAPQQPAPSPMAPIAPVQPVQ